MDDMDEMDAMDAAGRWVDMYKIERKKIPRCAAMNLAARRG